MKTGNLIQSTKFHLIIFASPYSAEDFPLKGMLIE